MTFGEMQIWAQEDAMSSSNNSLVAVPHGNRSQCTLMKTVSESRLRKLSTWALIMQRQRGKSWVFLEEGKHQWYTGWTDRAPARQKGVVRCTSMNQPCWGGNKVITARPSPATWSKYLTWIFLLLLQSSLYQSWLGTKHTWVFHKIKKMNVLGASG